MLSELVEVAQKTFNNREDSGELTKKMAQVLLTMNREKGDGRKGNQKGRGARPGDKRPRRSGLGKNECACWKGEGHWKNESPQRPQGRPAPVLVKEVD